MTDASTYLEPCQMADRFYHIGTKKGPCYLLETTDGLVLIDTAFPQTANYLLEQFRKLGKDPRDIRHIIHTHGHYDHIGATRALVALSGATTYIGAGDEDAVMGNNDLTYATELGQVWQDAFTPDVILHDGDVLHLGDTAIRFVATPGHTAGTLSLFFPLLVGGKVRRAGMFGGAGQNTLSRAYLAAHALPLSMREQYLASIEKIIREDVEFHIGNHLDDNNFYDKVKRCGGAENPFLSDNTYTSFLERKRQQALTRFATDW